MAKKRITSESDLEAMGLVRQDDGSYKKPMRGKKDLFGQPKPTKEKSSAENFFISKDGVKFHAAYAAYPIIEKKPVVETPDFDYKPVTEWFIPYQVPSKKNSRQVFVSKKGKMVNIPSKAYSDYITATKRYWEVFGIEFRKTVEKLELKWPLDIEMTFTRKTNQIVDYFGPGESVFDLMSDFAWWPDDSRRFGKPFFGDMIVDKNNPGVLIKIININGRKF